MPSNASSSSAALLDSITRTGAAPSPAHATTLPPEAYSSAELFGLETERIFKAGWMPLCRVEQVAEPGSYYSIDLLGVPLVVTRDRRDELHVLSRSCRHRWMDVCSGSGTARALQCPYHLWTYGLDGHLAGAPEMAGSTGFDRSDYSLLAYRFEVWQGFVFVNLDGEASSLESQMSGLSEIVGPYDLGAYQTVASTDWGTCPWDWKVMVDNFMECYHHMGPHRQSLEDEYPARLSYIEDGGEHYSVMWSPQADGFPVQAPFLMPRAADLPEKLHRKSMIFIAYPLLQVVVGPGFMYWLKTLPIGPGEMKLQLDIGMSPAALAAPDAEVQKAILIDAITTIHTEDIDVCARVQQAINSGATGVGRLSLLEKGLWEFYRYLGRKLQPAASAPAALRWSDEGRPAADSGLAATG